jgi:predicted nuclease of predicted toxin-antitoxin system
MRFLADQDVYQATVEALRSVGHDGGTARTLSMQRAADETLLRRARDTGRLLITRDKDSEALVFLMEVAAPGVILLRITPGTMDDVHAERNRLLSAHSGEELRGQFCVVEPHRYRICRTPPA